jgi:hypothetical protein
VRGSEVLVLYIRGVDRLSVKRTSTSTSLLEFPFTAINTFYHGQLMLSHEEDKRKMFWIRISSCQRSIYMRSPHWETLTANDLFDTEVDSKYFQVVKVAKALICRVLTKFFPTEMRKSKEDDNLLPIPMPELFRIPPDRSDVHTLETLTVDQSTIEGNLKALRLSAESETARDQTGKSDR